MKGRVLSAESEQLVVRSLLNDASFVEHADRVGVADSRDAMRNNQTRATPHHAA